MLQCYQRMNESQYNELANLGQKAVFGAASLEMANTFLGIYYKQLQSAQRVEEDIAANYP